MRQCVTIAGDAAVGKKTLIRRLLGDAALRERLGLHRTIEVFGYSFKPLSEATYSKADIVLIQWQWSTDSITQELAQRGSRMRDRHRVLLLWRPWEDHLKALHRCHGTEFISDHLQREWTENILPRFEQLARFGWEVEIIEATTYFRLGTLR